MNVIFIAIIFFIFSTIIGIIFGLFIAGVGKNNEEYEYYHEGFINGYTEAKEEMYEYYHEGFIDGYTKAKEEIK